MMLLFAQVHLDTLHDVIAYMVEKTEGYLIPLDMEGQYDKNICTSIFVHPLPPNAHYSSQLNITIKSIHVLPFTAFIAADNENGERTQHLLLDSAPAKEDPVPGTVL